MKRIPCVLGIDVGTESVRAVLFDKRGHSHGESSAGYATLFVRPGWVEQRPQEIWDALLIALRRLVETVPEADIMGCSLASTAVTVVSVDGEGNAFGPAILWMDTRASAEAAEINAIGHPALWYTGHAVSPEWMLPKALWLKRHDPQRYHQAHYLVEVHDWLLFRLTGCWALSLSTISSEWCYVRTRGGWPSDLLEMLDLADLSQKWPTDILQVGQMIGYLQDEVATATGLPRRLLVAQGLMDSYAASVGANVFAPGSLTFSLGSSSSYLGLVETPISDPRLFGPVPDAFGIGTWAMQGGQTSAASLLRWFRDQFAPGVEYATLDKEASLISPGCEGLSALDTWQGSRTPHRDPDSRGSFWGLGLGHTRAHLYRALLEAVAYGGRQIVEIMQDAGMKIEGILACGGGSRSSLWMQIHADILGKPIAVLDEPHAAALGAAVCAAVATGWYDNVRTAAAAFTRPGRAFFPNPEYQQVYREGYARYLAGYDVHRLHAR
jgi:ribulose kinase